MLVWKPQVDPCHTCVEAYSSAYALKP
jgi:hypothetical protein